MMLNTQPYVPIPVVVEGTQMTYSVYVKGDEGDRARLMVHADPWGVYPGPTVYGQITEMDGDWKRLELTFTITDSSLINKILFRIMWDPGYDENNLLKWDPSNQSSIEQHSIYSAGAMCELGPIATAFHRQGTGTNTTVELGSENILRFEDPNGKIIIGDLNEGEEFNSQMVGGKLIINSAHATLDLSETLIINEIDSEPVTTWDVQEMDGPTGNPRTGGMISRINAYNVEQQDAGVDPLQRPILDEGLMSQAIEVSDQFGVSTFSRGYNHLAWSSIWAGTADFGYHAQWVNCLLYTSDAADE